MLVLKRETDRSYTGEIAHTRHFIISDLHAQIFSLSSTLKKQPRPCPPVLDHSENAQIGPADRRDPGSTQETGRLPHPSPPGTGPRMKIWVPRAKSRLIQ